MTLEPITVLHAFLAPTGAFATFLTAQEDLRVRRSCDGLGDAETVDLLCDWSHVRDSSDEAISSAMDVLCDVLVARGFQFRQLFEALA
jgi:hypothetical protein